MDLGALFDSLLVNPMMGGLVWLVQLTGSAGLAIIIFTIFVRALMLPLSIYQSKSQKAMMALQPEIKAVQQKYGKDRERLTQETMRLYREHGVNPASGCLPLLLQLPIFYGLYWALTNLGQDPTLDARGVAAFREPFLWLPSLAQPDAIQLPGFDFFPIPGPLPLFMAASQYFMSKLMQMPSTDPQMQSMNKMMTVFMPLMLLFFGVTFPSGLVLYWAVSNVFSIVQQGFTTGWGPILPSAWLAGDAAPSASAVEHARASSRTTADVSDNGKERPSARQPGGSTRSVKGAKGKRRGKR